MLVGVEVRVAVGVSVRLSVGVQVDGTAVGGVVGIGVWVSASGTIQVAVGGIAVGVDIGPHLCGEGHVRVLVWHADRPSRMGKAMRHGWYRVGASLGGDVSLTLWMRPPRFIS